MNRNPTDKPSPRFPTANTPKPFPSLIKDDNMTIQFLKLVKEMREAQKWYFRNRSPQALQKSKDLEKKVDEEIQKELDAKHGEQSSLF